MKTLIPAYYLIICSSLIAGCVTSPPPGISVARALCEIKVGFLKDEANFPGQKIGVIPSTISVELVVEATKTSKGQLELGLAMPTTQTTAGALFAREKGFKNTSTITVNFVNPLTLAQSTIAGKSSPSDISPPRWFNDSHFTTSKDAFETIKSLERNPLKADASSDGAAKASTAEKQNFDCSSLDRAA
ncbi:hypothetical protein ACCD10_16190 [Pseudomonas sp. Pseusp122]|uniref:hypothetical protein n=1 Tax=unclassified Pseudomonas TaxID=196821 RepID=UPI0039A47EFB